MAKPARKPSSRPACPSCGSSLAVMRVGYGYVTEEMAHRMHEEGMVPGGCVLDDASPRWYCEACQTSFGRIGDAA